MYLGFVRKKIGDDNYLVEQGGFWGHAKAEYVQTISEEQILLCWVNEVFTTLAPPTIHTDPK